MLTIEPLADSIAPYVEVLSNGSSGYLKAWDALMPEMSTSLFAPILPFSIIVRNTSGMPLRGLTVLYVLQSKTGKENKFQFSARNLDSGTAPILRPNGYRFYSPSAPANDAVLYKRPELLSLMKPPLASVASTLAKSQSVKVSVEIIVDSNGDFRGPDRLGVFAAAKEEERAALWLASRLSGKATLEQRRELEGLSKLKPTSRSAFDRDRYTETLANTARRLLAQMDSGRDGAVTRFLEYQRRQIAVTGR